MVCSPGVAVLVGPSDEDEGSQHASITTPREVPDGSGGARRSPVCLVNGPNDTPPMRSSVRTTAIALAGFGLVASPLLVTGPASAASTGLTQSTCKAAGGTFTLAKGLKTCVTSEVIPIDAMNGPVEIHLGPIRATYYLHVFGDVTVKTTQVQRGKTITTSQSDVGDVTTEVAADSRMCDEEGAGGAFIPIDLAVCEELGLYDLED